MDEYIGIIKAFAGTFAIRGWLFCQGQILSIAQYQALFSLLGTTYGGNGTTTFALPDLRGRVPVGAGQLTGGGFYDLGQIGGTENITLNSNQMPAHTHAATATSILYAEGDAGDQSSPNGNMLGVLTNLYVTPTPSDNEALSNQAIATTVTNSIAGGSQPFSVLNPYLVINYLICIEGIYPPRP